MLHHTTDPAARAASIADRTADQMCLDADGHSNWFQDWLTAFYEVLKEFTGEKENETE